ncbi:MAG: hypothetical protein DLM58_20620 [Pseudonocardiales bacterium]|nr:MAG: hypothetical protein DLM58_20620 [Pseudonocardiales bacterium]
MGHGPDEAALGVHLRVAWRTLVLAGTPDTQILPTLALLLKTDSAGHPGFVTALDVTIDVDRASVVVRVAGHPAPMRCAHGKTEYLDVQIGPPLGVEAPGAAAASGLSDWPETQASLDPGSALVLYTDGLLDAYAKLVDDADLDIGELVETVNSCAVGER